MTVRPAEQSESIAVETAEQNARQSTATGTIFLCVFASLLAYSAIRAPVPAVNEPHYLAKAKHFWDPDWCRDDFFLNSSNPHLVFYTTVGALTQWCSLTVTAWIARIAGLALVAAGWVAVCRRLSHTAWSPVWAAWAWLALMAAGNFSGEWVIGGTEGKVFSYGFLLLGIAAYWDLRFLRACVCLGLTVSFHPVVGGWAVLCGGLAAMWTSWRPGSSLFPVVGSESRMKKLALGVPLFAVFAAPGLWPAVQMLGSGTASDSYAATYNQVFVRLKHHLDPMMFSQRALLATLLLIICWLLLQRSSREETSESRSAIWWRAFVLASVVVAVMGYLAGWGVRPTIDMPGHAWRMKVLKFYPFRLADALVPLAAAVTLSQCGTRLFSMPGASPRRIAGACWMLFAALFAFSLLMPSPDRNASRYSADRLRDWKAVCAWVRENTPSDAVFKTPYSTWAFHWHAQRAEYVSYKNCPQEAAGILEWERRLKHDVADAFVGATSQRVTHIITDTEWQMPVPALFEQGQYQIYAVPTDAVFESSE